jgi:cytidyltransferase-like protein
MLGSLRKRRDPLKAGSVMTPSVIEDFNKLVDKISGISQREEGVEFKTFEDYLKLKTVNESIVDAIEVIQEERVLNYRQFMNLGRISLPGPIVEALTVPHKEQGKQKVNMIVGRFQPFTLGHAKVFEQIHKQNGLPVVVFTVRGKKPDPDKSPFSEELQQAMFAKMQREYPFLEAMYVAPSAAVDTLYSMLRPAYEPVLWGYGTDRKKQYDFMINKPEYREQLGVDPSFSGYEIKRADEDVSASQVREAIMLDDKKTFERMTPRSIHDMWETLQDVLVPIVEELVSESKGTDPSIEAKNPGTLHTNEHMIEELESSKKIDAYKKYIQSIPAGMIAADFFKYLSSLSKQETNELVKYLSSLNNIRDLDARILYGNKNSVIGRLFDVSARGTGKGELAIAWLVNGAQIQGGTESYDVEYNGNKYEVKDWSTQGSSSILTGVKSKVTNFEFWKEIIDTTRRLDKLTGRSGGSAKFNLAMYFDPEFVSIVNQLLDEQSMILSGEVSKERLNLIKRFYEQASNIKNEVVGYSNVILRGPNTKPIELSIVPVPAENIKSGTFTLTTTTEDESLTYILAELRRLKYVRDPSAFEADMQSAVDQITKDITYIVFRKNSINFVEPGGFKPDVISISSLKFIEKSL